MKVVIFDLDGTLLDTVGGLAKGINLALAERGFSSITDEQCASFVGNGYFKLTERALAQDEKQYALVPEDQRAELIQNVAKSFMKHYADVYLDAGTPFKGIVPLLEHLLEKGIHLAVNSNKKHPLVAPMLAKFLPTISFDAVLGELEDAPRKPDPQGVYRIIESIKQKYGFSGEADVLYVGDSEVDLKTAQHAGIKGIHVQWGTRSYEQIKSLPHLLSTDDVLALQTCILEYFFKH